MIRHPRWIDRADALLREYAQAEYDQLTCNCLLYARDLVLAVTGTDPLDALGVDLADLDTVAAQLRLLHDHSGDVRNVVTAAVGEPVPRLWARTGDLAAVMGTHGWSIGYVDGDLVHLLHDERGLARRALAEADCAWRLGA